MYTRIYTHVIYRIKDDQLHLEGPNQKLNKEISYCKNQINLADRDIKEYLKEKVQTENEFIGLLAWFKNKTTQVQLVADREKKEAKETKKYKGIFKMEIIKKQEEQSKADMIKKRRENIIEERKQKELEELINQRNEIEGQKIKQEQIFELFQKQINIKKIDDLPIYYDALEEDKEKMEREVQILIEKQKDKLEEVAQIKLEISQLRSKKQLPFEPGTKEQVAKKMNHVLYVDKKKEEVKMDKQGKIYKSCCIV